MTDLQQPAVLAAIGALLAAVAYCAWITHLLREHKRLDRQLERQRWIARLRDHGPIGLPPNPTIYRDTGGGRLAGMMRRQPTIPPESE